MDVPAPLPRTPVHLSRRAVLAGLLGAAGAAAVPVAWRGVGARAEAEVPDTYPGPGGLSLHLSTVTNMSLDGQLVRHIVDNYEHLSLRAEFEIGAAEPALDPEPYSYAQIVARLKARRPDFPVRMYAQTFVFSSYVRLPPEQVGVIDKNEQVVLAGFDTHPEWLVARTPNNKSTTHFWLDPGVAEFRDALIANIVHYVQVFGVDGVFCDSTQLRGSSVLTALGDGTPALAAYQASARSLFDELRSALCGKPLIFNGLWSDEDGAAPGWFEAQQSMLPHADGASVEFFGWDIARNRRNDVTQYFDLPAAYPDKMLFFKGRPKPRAGADDAFAYLDFAEEFLWQRYCYVAYLVCAGPNTFYQFNATFQEPTIQGRSGPDALYVDWRYDLGAALTPSYESDGTLFWRRFEKAVVVLNPDASAGTTGPATTFTFPEQGSVLWTPEGRQYRGSVSLRPGQAQLLLATKPTSYAPKSIRFDNDDCPGVDWYNARWAGRYLQLTAIADSSYEFEHDLMLDPMRSLRPCTSVVIVYQTRDADARFDVVVEVDDAMQERMEATVSATTTAPAEVMLAPATPFRTSAQAVANYVGQFPDTFAAGHVIPASTRVVVGGRRTLVIDVPASLAAYPTEPGGPPRYTARRLAHLRIIGSVNLVSVTLNQRHAPA